ncbi:succinyldiaminopimelate transaminase [Salinibacterium sp. NG253]|uniref:succinyldiaminopimelate transaminase n=1 Tax=Salinibacterium sp. NG253 TaxID=2792039 RepID=UPI0027DB08C2|nr:succinyldiaminopimelate transaminase [Salinibacterium sp. NG253]
MTAAVGSSAPVTPSPMEVSAELRRRAVAHPGGFADLATASPVDPTPQVFVDALASAGGAPGYPLTIGVVELRDAMVNWFDRIRGVTLNREGVLPTIGSKELLGLLPFLLGLGADDVVVRPALAYPAYEAGALAVGASVVAEDDPAKWPEATKLIWLNSPRNPDGQTLTVEELRRAVARARELGAVIVGDECYAVLNERNGERIPSILDPRVIGDDMSQVLACYSVSKQSNMAGYRGGMVAGDEQLIGTIASKRRSLGLMVPAPVQQVLSAVLSDDEHVVEQRDLYTARLERLRTAVEAAGLEIHGSESGLYLWATRGESGIDTAMALADIGVLVSPGEFYGPSGTQFVRFAVTVRDEYLDRAIIALQSWSR